MTSPAQERDGVALKGEGETQFVQRTRARVACDYCGEPATHRHTYLNEGQHGARQNPASAAYGKDDVSWCCDFEDFVCDDCHRRDLEENVPAGYRWCASFSLSPRFEHMFLRWHETALPSSPSQALVEALEKCVDVRCVGYTSDGHPYFRDNDTSRAALRRALAALAAVREG